LQLAAEGDRGGGRREIEEGGGALRRDTCSARLQAEGLTASLFKREINLKVGDKIEK
jgi:hypothetical protein